MTGVKKHFLVLLVIIGLLSNPLFGTAEAQLQSGQQGRTGASVPRTIISSAWTTNTTLLGHIEAVRHTIMPIGLEIDITKKREIDVSRKLFKEESVSDRIVSVTVSNDTLAGALDKIVSRYPDYTWRLDGSTACIDVYPKDGAVCAKTLPPYSIKAQSIEGIFTNNVAGLKELNISLSPEHGRSRPIYQDLVVDLDFKGGTFMDFLNRLTLAIGDNASWTLRTGYGHVDLVFNVSSFTAALRSYKPAWDERMSASEKLARKTELLSKATGDRERMHLLRDIATLYAQTGDKQMAAKTFDDAIQAAVSDEDRCDIKEGSVQLLHAINQPAEAERAIEIYREILRSCPYEHTRIKGILDLAYVLYSVDRETEVVAVLKDAATQYPSRTDVIRKTMRAYYPSHLKELPEPPVTTSNGIPLIFYQRLPTTNPPQKEIHFNFP